MHCRELYDAERAGSCCAAVLVPVFERDLCVVDFQSKLALFSDMAAISWQ